MNKKIIKSLNIIDANYLITGRDNTEIKLYLNYKNNYFEINGDKNSEAYIEAVKKAKDLLNRKSGVTLV